MMSKITSFHQKGDKLEVKTCLHVFDPGFLQQQVSYRILIVELRIIILPTSNNEQISVQIQSVTFENTASK